MRIFVILSIRIVIPLKECKDVLASAASGPRRRVRVDWHERALGLPRAPRVGARPYGGRERQEEGASAPHPKATGRNPN